MLFKLAQSIILAIAVFHTGHAQEPGLVLWGAKVSPFVRKDLVVLEYKGMPYELKETLPSKLLNALNQPVPEAFSHASPLGKIPALQQGDFTISDSSVIAAYIEKIHPQNPVYPGDAQDFAKALWLEEYADSIMTEVIHNKIFMELVVKPLVLKCPADDCLANQAVKDELPQIFDYLEGVLSASGGNYLVGNHLTIADIGVANHFVSLKLAQISLDASRWPKLDRYIKLTFEEPSFKKAAGDFLK